MSDLPRTKIPQCSLFREELREIKLTVLDDCPACKEEHHVLVKISHHRSEKDNPQTQSSADTLNLSGLNLRAKISATGVKFTKSIDDLNNLFLGGSLSCKNFVNLEPTINECLKIVNEFCEHTGDSLSRIPPLVISRLARGGKTTIATSLFSKLKECGFSPIIISFNGSSGFKHLAHESHLMAILRCIAFQFVDSKGQSLSDFDVDAEYVIELLKNAQGKLVLIIDELNILSHFKSIDEECSNFLKKYFLDAKNRYLVYTTHIPMNVEPGLNDVFESKVNSSERIVIAVPLPFSYNIELLRSNLKYDSLTPFTVATYGGIPSLMYSAKHEYFTPALRFRSRKFFIENKFHSEVFAKFISCVISGKIEESTNIRSLYQFGTLREDGLFIWPLCYISCICSLFDSIDESKHIESFLESAFIYGEKIESGLDWETIVQSAILIRCLDSSLNGSAGPFNICKIGVKPRIQVVYLDEQFKTIQSWIDHCRSLYQLVDKSTIFVILSLWANFPLIDGLLIFFNPDIKSSEVIIGYQVKLGKSCPDTDLPIGTTGYLIRGKAPDIHKSNGFKNWNCYTKNEVSLLLGYSLKQMILS